MKCITAKERPPPILSDFKIGLSASNIVCAALHVGGIPHDTHAGSERSNATHATKTTWNRTDG